MKGKTSKKNVTIQADHVQVKETNSTGSKPSHPNRSSGGRRRNSQARGNPKPFGIATSLSNFGSRGGGFGDQSTRITEQAEAFIERCCDPCGEHGSNVDSGRVPDGALETSAPAFFRGLATLTFPWSVTGHTDLTGATYSILFFMVPMFRSLTFMLIRANDGEFDGDVMRSFCKSFANIDSPKFAYYPKWVEMGGGNYWSAFDTAALRSLVPPGSVGVSTSIESYRFTSNGMVVYFNAPDLINQGTCTVMRYPLDVSSRVFEDAEGMLPGTVPTYLRTTTFRFGSGPNEVSVFLNISPADFVSVRNPIFPFLAGTPLNFPTPKVKSKFAYRNSSNTFTVAVDDEVQYVQGNDANANIIYFKNATKSTKLQVATIPSLSGNTMYGGERFYTTTTTAPFIDDADSSIQIMVIPPVTQADMLQQNPRTMVDLLKQTDGIYSVGAIFQPVMRVTPAGSYSKVAFATPDTTATEIGDTEFGWFDTLDLNFGINVVNFQGIPRAARPMLKVHRSVEIVPSANSIIGAFATGAPPEQPEAVEVVKAFNAKQPHGYPEDYNFFGRLFGNILSVINSLPDVLRDGRNIAREVNRICDLELGSNSKSNGKSGRIKHLARA